MGNRDVFGDDELPVLFAHGHHNRPEDVVLAAAEYRRAYADKLARVQGQLIRTGHLVWIGFSFADRRIGAVIREVAEGSGTRVDPGTASRHVAIMPWDPVRAERTARGAACGMGRQQHRDSGTAAAGWVAVVASRPDRVGTPAGP